MKNNLLIKFLLAIFLFSFCLAGIAVANADREGGQANDKLNRIEHFRKVQAERKQQYEIKIETWYRARLEMLMEFERLELNAVPQYPDLFKKHADLEREKQEQIDKLEAWNKAQLHRLMKYGHLDMNGATEFPDPLASLEMEKNRQRRELQAREREQMQKLRFKDPEAIDRLNNGIEGDKKARSVNSGNLAATGAISGKVTDDSAAGIQNIYIYVYDMNYDYIGSGQTDASGDYSVTGLDTGSYKISFDNNSLNYLSEWYDDQASFYTADAVAVTDGITTLNINAQLAAGAEIRGKVSNASAVGIAGIYVNIRDASNNSIGYDYTDASGNYEAKGLPTGSCRVHFENSSLNYIPEWYNNKASFDTADPVAVTAGSITYNINAQLATGGEIRGKVTNVSAIPIQNIYVQVYDSGNHYVGSSSTDAGGTYAVKGLPTGGYMVRFNNNGLNYLTEWYNNKTSFATADSVAVTAGNITYNINAQLAAGGQITGKVTDVSAVGIANIYVTIRDASNNYIDQAYTDASGDYSVDGLPTGSYRVYFDNSGLNFVSEWYNDKTSFALADAVAVTAGSTIPNIDAQLATGGQITGRVTNASAVGIPDIIVSIQDSSNNTIDHVHTDATGNYSVIGLPTGSFKVYFINNSLNYVSEWYNNKTSFDAADAVAVTAGSTTPNINAQLVAGGEIRGKVTNASAVGIQNIYVVFYDLSYDSAGYVYTDASGNYSISGLIAGSYKVSFNSNDQDYISEWYNNKMSFNDADAVAVTAGGIASNINAQLATGGQIRGKVTNASAAGIENINVTIRNSSNDTIGSDSTDASGTYRVNGLPTGSYKVYFSNNNQNYLSEWYNNKTSFDVADAVAVTAGSITYNINAQLTTGGQIRGKVTNTSAVGIENIYVTVRNSSNDTIGSDHTDASGIYRIEGLPSGSYRVYFSNHEQNYVSEWYNNQTSFEMAGTVAVSAGSITYNINAQLAAGGQISGKVTDASAVGIEDIYVAVYDLGYNRIAYDYTDASGNYSVVGLPTGNFKVDFDNNEQNFVSEWYNNQTSFYTADPVAVTAGSTTPNINAQLATGGKVTGKVTDASAIGIHNIYVSIYNSVNNYITSDYTDANGNYSLNGLLSDSYRVYFGNSGQNYISEWYNNKTSFNTANAVLVSTGSTVNINAQLATGGQVSGKVTNASAIGIEDIEVTAYDSAWNYLASAYTDNTGNYIINGLPTGSCKVEFDDQGMNYLSEWYNNQASFDTADAVVVTSGSNTPNINAQLATGGQISGKVTDASAVGIQDIYVAVYDSGNDYLGYDYTDASGNYTVSGLPTGSHRVQFYDYDYIYQYEWYNNKANFASADPVTVTVGSTTPNINAQLGFGGKSITVSSPNGGETLTAASFHNITWYYTGSIASVNIDYSVNNGTSWNSVVSNTANDESYGWSVANAPSTTCLVRVRSAADDTVTDTSNAVFTILASGAETVSAPYTPTGQTSGMTSTSFIFSTGGSTTSMGNSVQYMFDWDDGTTSGWLGVGVTSAAHTWSSAGTYDVRAKARCATHTTVESLWSGTQAMIIYSGSVSGMYNSPAQYKVLPEVIWASASGGGTWISDAQVTDVTGGSQVFVYYNTESGRRGPFLLWDNSSGSALSSKKIDNLLAAIDELDYGSFTYFGTVGAVEFITQDGNHKLHVAVRELNGNYAKTSSGLSLHDANTATTSRAMIIPNLTNNASYRASCGLFNPTNSDVTVGLKLREASNAQVGSTIIKTLAAHGVIFFNPFTAAGIPYPGTLSDDIVLVVQPTSGTGRVVCFGASANNTSNDPAAHVAVQNATGYDNSPSNQQVLPEVIWALATGGGTWVSEVQVTDVSGGSQVSVYYNTATGRRGPFLLWNNTGGALSCVKYTNLLQTIDGLDTGTFTYYGTVGAVEFITQDVSHKVHVAVRERIGNCAKTFPGLNLVNAETADTSRAMLIQNYTSNSTYRSVCGLFNPTANAVTVEFTLLNSSGGQIGDQFSKTIAGHGFNSFNPFTEAGVSYPTVSLNNVILRVRPTSGTGNVVCFGGTANNTSNDPASHLAVQEE